MDNPFRSNSSKRPNYTRQPDAPGSDSAAAGTVEQATEGMGKTVDGTKQSVSKAQDTLANFAKGDANIAETAFAVNDAINSVQSFTAGISQAAMMPVLAKLAVFKGQAILPAGKQMDPVVGVDVHMVTIPPSPAPVPLPHPFVAIIMNPKDFVSCAVSTIKMDVLNAIPEAPQQEEGAPQGPRSVGDTLLENKAVIANMVMGLAGLSASVKFGSFIPRAITGTKTKNFPHIPFGAGWHPAFAASVSKNIGKVFLGSLFVTADGDPMTGSFHLNYDCWDVGAIDLFKSRRNSGKKSPDPSGPQAELFVPSGTVMPIPWGRPVLVNSVPTPINPLTALDRLFKAGLSKLKKAVRKKNEALIKKASESKLGKKIGCPFFTKVSKHVGTGQSHPVDVAEGYFYTDNEDFDLPGPIPLSWERTWYSYSNYNGPLGHGWHHSYDIALSIDEETGVIAVRMSDGRPVVFDIPAVQKPSFNRKEKLQLHLHEDGHYYVSDAKELIYNFSGKLYKNPFNKTEVHVLQSIANRNGFAIRFNYNEDGLLTQLIDSSGRKLKVENDEFGRIKSVHAPHPDKEDETFVIAAYSYNADGDMIRHEDALKQPMQFEYRNHLMVKEIWRNGLTWQFFYNGTDTKAKCIKVTNDDNLLHYQFDYSNPECTRVINSLGHQKLFYHKGGVVTKYIDPNGAEWIYRYNKFDELEWETDPLGNQTGYTHDAFGNVLTITQPDGLFTQTEYFHPQFKFFPTEEIDERGGKWQWTYDDAGNLEKTKNPLGAITSYTYDEGLLKGVTDALGNSTRLNYDLNYNLKTITAPNGGNTQYRYNELGSVVRVINPNGLSQTRNYDLLRRIRNAIDFDKNDIYLEYDALDNVVHYQDKKKEVWYTYKGLWKLTSRTQAGATIHFNYDTEEQLRNIINEHGLPYRFELDPAGNVVKETAFDGIVRQYQRNQAGWVTKVNRPGNRYTAYEHDVAGRIQKVTYQDGSTEAFQYEKGQLKKAVNANAQVEFVRDILGNVLVEKSNGHEIHSVYDALQRRTCVNSSMGADIALELDELDNITKMNANGWQANLQYDLLGLETGRHMTGDVKSEWERDALGRGVHHRVGNNSKKNMLSFLNRKYVWDVNDQLKHITDNRNGTTSFEYDQWDNLSRTLFNDGTEQLRNPDAVGNLFESRDRKDRKYNAGGKLIESKTAFYSYDEEGFLIEKKEKSGKVWKYEWNTAGMLQRVVRPDKAEVHFKYDALGRRLEKQYKKTITRFIWDGSKPLHEWKEFDAKDATADEIITWVFNEDDFAPTAKIKGEKKYSIVTDHLGTPVQGYNETGELIWDRELDSYGKIRMLKGDEGFCNYLYQGQTLDAETGLAYNRFRYYDPEEGIYVSQDFIGIEGGLQFYNYVDDPNTYIDEFGLLERPYIRKGTRQTIESRGKVRRGRFLDPNTGKPIPGDKRRSYSRAKGEYDIGHKTGHEHWRLVKEAKKRKYTQQQFNNWVNKNPQWFQVEDPNENQSHKHEKKRKTATYKRI